MSDFPRTRDGNWEAVSEQYSLKPPELIELKNKLFPMSISKKSKYALFIVVLIVIILSLFDLQ